MSKRLTIEELKKIAVSRGGLLLSETYINNLQKLLWRCEKGHEWQACASNVKNLGSWCPTCGGSEQLTIEDMQKLAKEHNGLCLSKKYVNARQKLLWRCEEGHEWKTTATQIRNKGSWCPTCAGVKKKTIKDMQELASKFNGSCLSKTYKNKETKLRWRCEEGHEWESSAGNIINGGHWCPTCSGNKKLTIEDMQKVAREHNGLCLSKKYVNAHQKLLWRCEKGHEWESAAVHVKTVGTWCPTCAGTKKLTIADMHRLAESRGGRFLSEEYVNSSTLHLWECADGHQWEAKPTNVSAGTWCPECVKGEHISEAICRTTFQQIFKKQFPKKKPKWLKNQKGNIMELDGFCSSLRIAFEYNGVQHYKTNFFIKDALALEKRKRDDELKKKHCIDNKVFLVVITYNDNLKELPVFIERELSAQGCEIDGFDFNVEIDFDQVSHHRSKIEKWNQFAKRHGITLLSKKYVNSVTKLEWSCPKNHKWSSSPAGMIQKLKAGQITLCPDCLKEQNFIERRTKREAKIREFIKSKGGELIQMDYKSRSSRITVSCKHGHTWQPRATNILEGKWCRTCYDTKRNTERRTKNEAKIREFIKSKGGELIQMDYKNRSSRITVSCKHGHTWQPRATNILEGKWCRTCYDTKRRASRVSR